MEVTYHFNQIIFLHVQLCLKCSFIRLKLDVPIPEILISSSVLNINRAQTICGGSVVLWLSGLCVGVQVCGRVKCRIVFGYRVHVFFGVRGEVCPIH